MSAAGGFCPPFCDVENELRGPIDGGGGRMSARTRSQWVATVRGSVLLVALAALMIILTAVGSLVLQHGV
jgi:hypothetical protein